MMKILLVLAALAAAAQAASIIDPETCSSFPCLVFDDDFDFLDFDAWEHEITLSGGGNSEFQAYVNNRSITYTQDSTLFIKPDLLSNWKGEEFLTTGHYDMWGNVGRNEVCTGNLNDGCERDGADGLLNPVLSGRLRTLPYFAFKFGRVEVRAKLPSGEWLWPAVWLLAKNYEYGPWPASGEIDLVESRGNADYGTLGVQYAATTLHWGPTTELNQYKLTHAEYSLTNETFADNFHNWTMEWTDTDLRFFVDDGLVLTVDPGTNFWDFGGYESTGYENPWRQGTNMAPFDKKYFLILNLAVGGTNGFFPDGVPSNPPKPWTNDDPAAPAAFWNGRADWLPTWEHGEGKISEKAALQVDYVKVYRTF